MYKLKMERQHLEDMCAYFLPLMDKILASRLAIFQGTEHEISYRVTYSIFCGVHKDFKRKQLNELKKVCMKYSEAEAIVFMQLLLQFPIPADHFWRMNLRNNFVDQLHKQLV